MSSKILRSAAQHVLVQAPPLKSWREIPGLKSNPLKASILRLLPFLGKKSRKASNYEMKAELHQKYGDIVKLENFLLRGSVLMLFDPHHIEQLIRSEEPTPRRDSFPSLEYYRTHYRSDYFDGMYGLLTNHGESWKSVRLKVNPVLMKPDKIKDHKNALDSVAKDMIERLRTIKDDQNKIREDFIVEMNKYALESIGVVALGGRLGCLENKLNEKVKTMIQVINDVFILSNKLEGGLWKYFPTSDFKKAMKTYEMQLRLSEHFINKAIVEFQSKGENQEREKCVLESLLEIDKKVAIVMASDMLFAGVDTVSHSIISLMYLLATHPKKQSKLREEIKKGDSTTYLKACIKEGLRLCPIVPVNLRRTTKEHIIGNYSIPIGIDIVIPNEYLSLQEENFPRSKEFIPERWLANRSDPLHYSKAHQMVYLPFGFGMRSCIGRRIAEIEMECFITRLIDDFVVRWDGEPLKRVTHLLTVSQPPYYFSFDEIK